MDLKDLLCQIESDGCNLHTRRSSLCSRLKPLDPGTVMPYIVGASIPLLSLLGEDCENYKRQS